MMPRPNRTKFEAPVSRLRHAQLLAMTPKAFVEALQADPKSAGRDPTGSNLLHKACAELSVAHIKVLLLDSPVAATWRRRVDMGALDGRKTPVMMVLERLQKSRNKPHAERHAEYLKAREIIALLHKKGADLNQATGAGIALFWAAGVEDYQLPLCRFLMRLGADPCVPYDRSIYGENVCNILCDVINLGMDKGTGGALLKALIAKCNLDRPCRDEVPLEAAYDQGDVGAFEILLQEGAQIPPKLFATAQEYAQSGGKEEVQMWELLKKHSVRRVRAGDAPLAPGAQFIGADFMQTEDGRPEQGRRYFYDSSSMNKNGRVPMLFDQDLLWYHKNPYTERPWNTDRSVLRWWSGKVKM